MSNMNSRDAKSFHCLICESRDIVFHSKYRGKSPIFLNLNMVYCSNCGMFFAAPVPFIRDLKIYNEAYSSNAHNETSFGYSPFFSAMAKIRINHILDYIKQKKITVSSVLEYGPGRGALAEEWLRVHSSTRYVIEESDKLSVNYLKKFGVKTLSQLTDHKVALNHGVQLSSSGSRFDLIIMSHVLEHVPNPKEFLSSAIENLRPGGVLFIEVPCLDFLFKNVWEPHLLFFDKPQIIKLLDGLNLTSLKVTYHGRTIKEEVSRNRINNLLDRMKRFLIRNNKFKFLSGNTDPHYINSDLELAVIKPFKAHMESLEPSVWLRAVCVKPS